MSYINAIRCDVLKARCDAATGEDFICYKAEQYVFLNDDENHDVSVDIKENNGGMRRSPCLCACHRFCIFQSTRFLHAQTMCKLAPIPQSVSAIRLKPAGHWSLSGTGVARIGFVVLP